MGQPRIEGITVTHEELVGKIDRKTTCTCPENTYWDLSALRAVVELHKASKVEGRWGKITICCLRCQTNYPCPTIQAIEKELK